MRRNPVPDPARDDRPQVRRAPPHAAGRQARRRPVLVRLGVRRAVPVRPQHPGRPARPGAPARQVAQRHRASGARRRPARAPSGPAAGQQLRRAHVRHEPADRAGRPRPRFDGVDVDALEVKVTSVSVLVDSPHRRWRRTMESFVHLRKGKTPRAAARRPRRPQGRRTRPRRVHRPNRQHVPAQRPHRVPIGRPAAAHRRAVQRAEAQRRHRCRRRPAADVLQRRLPGAAVAAHRADAVLRPLRRR